MPRRVYLLGLAGALSLLLWRVNRERAGQSVVYVAQQAGSLLMYTPPVTAKPYLATIAAAEKKFGIPAGLLVRLLDVESIGYRADVIDGRTHSPTGAVGIGQVLTSTARSPGYGLRPLTTNAAGRAPGDERCDPAVAIPWAAQYLRAMYDRAGSWRKACASYNQGLGTVLKAVKADAENWLSHVPAEGRKYVASIPDKLGIA